MKRILIADDHGIVRIGTALLIKELLDEEVEIEHASTFDQALAILQKGETDLILLDINLPGGNNLDMIAAIKVRDQKTRILVFSSYDESIFALRYIKAGAHGYLNKESSEEEFKKALLYVLGGNVYMSESLKEQKLSQLLSDKAENNNPLQSLSNREIEVANLMIKGMSTTEIAQALNIRLNTVSTYKAHIYQKLDVSNVVELIEKMKLITG